MKNYTFTSFNLNALPDQFTIKNKSQTTIAPYLNMNKEDYVEYFDSRFPSFLSVILLLIGLFGNVLCLYIFLQPNMRRNATFIYLACLALVDWFVLVLGLGDIVIISYLKFVLRDSNIFVCRIHSFLTYVFTHLSSFLLASVSIDRAIATNFIRFAKVYNRPNMAYKIILFNIVMASAINFHTLVYMGYYRINTSNLLLNYNFTNNSFSNNSSKIIEQEKIYELGVGNEVEYQFHCATESGTFYDSFLDPYFKWIDLFSYAIIPFLVMGVCTFLIIRVLFKSNMRLNKKKTSATSINKINNQELNSKRSQIGSSVDLEMELKQITSHSDTKSNLLTNISNKKWIIKKTVNQRTNKAKHLTYTLVTLNCLFFCLVSPLVIILIALDGSEIDNKILINFVYLLAYSNHSFNFILYGLSSPPYREALFKIFKIKK